MATKKVNGEFCQVEVISQKTTGSGNSERNTVFIEIQTDQYHSVITRRLGDNHTILEVELFGSQEFQDFWKIFESRTNPPSREKISETVDFSKVYQNPDELISLKDVAKLLNRHPESIRRWMRGSNPFIKPVVVNGFYYFKNSDISKFIEEQRQ